MSPLVAASQEQAASGTRLVGFTAADERFEKTDVIGKPEGQFLQLPGYP